MFLRILLLFLCGLVLDVKSQSDKCACTNRNYEPVCGGPQSGPGDVIQFLNECALALFNCNNSDEDYVVKYSGECSQSESAYASAPIIVNLQSLRSSALSGSGLGGQTQDSIPSSSSSTKNTKLSYVLTDSQTSEQERSQPLVIHSSFSQPDVIHLTEQSSGGLKSLSNIQSLPSGEQMLNLQSYFTGNELNSLPTSDSQMIADSEPYQKPVQSLIELSGNSDSFTPSPFASTISEEGSDVSSGSVTETASMSYTES